MKIYSNIFDLAQPVTRAISTPPNSLYAIGIKVVNDGVVATDYALKLFEDGSEIAPMETTIDGYKLFQKTSPSTSTTKVYNVVYVKGSVVQHFEIIDTTTDESIFDVDQSSGSVTLPIATESTLGGIKVGDNLTIDADGKLNGPTVTDYEGGTGINIENGVVSIDDTVALKSEIPTKTSELTNDSNFVQKNADGSLTIDTVNATNITVTGTIQAGDATITIDPQNFLRTDGQVAIPTAVSELTNDSGFVDQSQVESTAQTVAQQEIANQNYVAFEGEYEDGETFSFSVVTHS